MLLRKKFTKKLREDENASGIAVNDLKDCFSLAGQTIAIVTYQCPLSMKTMEVQIKGDQ